MATRLVSRLVLSFATLLSGLFFTADSLGNIPEFPVTCNSRVDLAAEGASSGLIVSRLPSRLALSDTEGEQCDMYFSFPVGHALMIYFDWLDLYDENYPDCNTTSLEVFDGSPNDYVLGLNSKICGTRQQQQQQMPPSNVYFLENRFLVIRVNGLRVIQGRGFSIHFTMFRRAFPCMSDGEFTCDTFGSRRCVSDRLVCDGWNDCGDWQDERQNCRTSSSVGR